ncbi:MAG: MinD/ParA family protein [Deltaproteobacteria bacterium]|nr:MinD/ParA family protein [Deltaproteobacteria bacterium]
METVSKPGKNSMPRVLSISSGKGGVGKSHIVVNLALALSEMGRRVLVWDADLGLANIDILTGINPKYNLMHFLSGERTIAEVLVSNPEGFDLIPAGSGIEELTQLNLDQKILLVENMERLASQYDYILIDTGAGISSNVLYFNLCAGEIVLIVVPEPTSLTDGYALIKVLHKKQKLKTFWLLPNSVKNEDEGQQIFNRMSSVCSQYLNIEPSSCGSILYDNTLTVASREQTPQMKLTPNSPLSLSIRKFAGYLDSHPLDPQGNNQFEFFKKLISYRQAE